MILALRSQNFTSILSALLLCLMLLCTQGAILHVHYSACEEEAPTEATHTDPDHGHAGHTMIHLATDDSHHHHAKAGMSELEISPLGLLTKLAGIDSLLLAIFCIFILLLSNFSRPLIQRNRESCPIPHQRFTLSPPLRAPPLG